MYKYESGFKSEIFCRVGFFATGKAGCGSGSNRIFSSFDCKSLNSAILNPFHLTKYS